MRTDKPARSGGRDGKTAHAEAQPAYRAVRLGTQQQATYQEYRRSKWPHAKEPGDRAGDGGALLPQRGAEVVAVVAHKAGDMGIVKVKSKAKLVASKGGKLSITGMRWTPVGIVG